MNLHLTTGTLSYLRGLKEAHPEVNIAAIGQDALLYYEDGEVDSVFKSKRTFSLIKSSGTLDENNTTSVHSIPIAGEKRGNMTAHLSELYRALGSVNGVQSVRIGDSKEDSTFIVLIQWAEASTYNDFKNTDDYSNYLSTKVLKKFRTAESLFQQAITSKLYLPLDENDESADSEYEDEL